MVKIREMPSGIRIIRWALVCREIVNDDGNIVITDLAGNEYIVWRYLGSNENHWSIGILV